jgi:hypothetical protein
VDAETQSMDHFTDALGRDLRYAVLTKRGRIQILLRPSAKELRKRGKRGWQLFGTVQGDGQGVPTLVEMVQRAVQGTEADGDRTADEGTGPKGSKGGSDTAGRKGKKPRGSKGGKG